MSQSTNRTAATGRPEAPKYHSEPTPTVDVYAAVASRLPLAQIAALVAAAQIGGGQ